MVSSGCVVFGIFSAIIFVAALGVNADGRRDIYYKRVIAGIHMIKISYGVMLISMAFAILSGLSY